MIKKKPAQTGATEVEKFVVRLPYGMRARIAEVSRLSHRSMNSEIVARLEDSLAGQTRVAEPQPDYRATRPMQSVPRPTGVDQEGQLISCFRRLSRERQRALIKFLEGSSEDH